MPDADPNDQPDLLSMLMPTNPDEAQAMLRAIQGQQADQSQQRADLQRLLGQQQQQAGGLRGLALVASLGNNPLLHGVRQTAEQQGMGLDNAAARTEARLASSKANALDPLRLIALQQAGARLKQQAADAAERAKRENAALGLRARALTAKENVQPKAAKAPTLPASEVASIADIGVATQALDDLVTAHGKTTTGFVGGVLGHIPNTDESEFNDKVKATAQVVGTILEHGKMTDGDIPKYAAMLPKITDSPERAAAKRDNVKKLLLQQAQQRKETFGQAGYNVGGIKVPDVDLNTPPPPKALPAAPRGVVPPGDPRSVKETRTLKDGSTLVIFADGHGELRKPTGGP